MSRDAPPPLPGGYKVGEKVFYGGESHTFENGGKLVHGQQGEVMGPATGKSTKGKCLEVLFPGNKNSITCVLTEVRLLPAASAATPCTCAPHTRDAAHAPRTATFPRLACAPAPQPQLQEGSCQEPTLLASALVNVRR